MAREVKQYVAGSSIRVIEEIYESIKTGKPRPNTRAYASEPTCTDAG